MIIEILGAEWIVKEQSEAENERLKDCDGYCDWTAKEIVIQREAVGTLGDMEAYINKVKRHEIVHAFLFESGLAECSGSSDTWALNETMVDWFARQGVKIYNAWEQAECVD